jgi:hypothetical protein
LIYFIIACNILTIFFVGMSVKNILQARKYLREAERILEVGKVEK